MEPYVVLARRYRPRTFSEVLGQAAVGRTLVKAIETGRVAHSYLFSGPRGIGKTSMARILAKALCCQAFDEPTPTPCDKCEVCVSVTRGDDLDVIEIDGASNRGIDEVRQLRDNARYAPARARQKIYIIDEVHMLTEQAFNALLKILEEPPPHVKFIFATTEPQKVPATIISRCQRFHFRRIATRTILEHLQRICSSEGVEADPAALLAVAQSSNGGMRDAQSLLDQLITLGEGAIRAADVEQLLGTVTSHRMEELLKAVGEGRDGRAIELYEGVYDQGIDAAEFLKQILEVCRDLLVLSACGEESELVDLPAETRIALAGIGKAWGKTRILYALGLFAETLKTVKSVGEGRALVELAIVKLAQAGRLRSLDDIVADLKDLEGRMGGPVALAPAPAVVVEAPPPKREPLLVNSELPEGALAGEESVKLTLDRVRSAWDGIVLAIKQKSSVVGSFLESACVLGLRDDAVSVGFPPSARFFKTQLDDPDRIRTIEDEIEAGLGVRLRLETVVTDAAAEAAASEAQQDGPAGQQEEQPVGREEVEKVGREPIVSALKDIFRARLIHIERT